MTAHVYAFDKLPPEQGASAGGKGSTLARLYQAGYPVPYGSIILPSAFVDDQLAPESWPQIQEQLARMRKRDSSTSFAVRSSAWSEDSALVSFAGEFETVLDVYTDDDIRQAIHTVRQSRLGERVRAYSQAKGLDPIHEIAVVVQQLVPANISGVLFTADPITGSRSTMHGNFVRGLGDQLVSGEVTGCAFTIQRPGGHYDGPPDLKPFARRLLWVGRQLEQDLGGPQDVEWAISGTRLYLLQSRPITTLVGHNPATGEWNDSLTGDFLWTNVNLGEAIPDVMTPFTWSVLRRGALGEWIEFRGHRAIGNIAGRPYFNISIFASIFRLLGKRDRDMLEMIEGTLHLSLPDGMEIPFLPAPKRTLLTVGQRLMALQQKQVQDVRKLPALLAANPIWCHETQRRIQGTETPAALASLWRAEIKPYTSEAWSVYLSATNSHVNHTTQLRRRLARLVGPVDADALISATSNKTELLASLGPLVGLSQLVRGEISGQDYAQLYGHRGPHEFEFSLPRPSDDPAWLDRQVAEFERSPVDIEALMTKQRASFEAAWHRLSERYPWKAIVLRRKIDQVAPRARLREAIRSEFGHVTWIIRRWALRAGELTGLGDDVFFLTVDELLDVLAGDQRTKAHIPARRETFARYQALPPYPAVIRGRFDPFQWAADPNRRVDVFDSHAPTPALERDKHTDNDTIHGAAGAAGRVEGIVRRLDGPDEGELLQPGEILVTAQTNIGWTVLFSRAAAIVTDVGAPLSHTAIVARELGLPAVVGCGDATQRLKTGDRVLVDGGQGVVRLLDRQVSTRHHIPTSQTP